jgi:hypothetical protein
MGYPQAAILALALCALLPGRALAQADTAYAREVYGEVQKQLGQMPRMQFNATQPGIPVPSRVSAWSQGKEVRKIQVIAPDPAGDVVSEYYYAKGALVFAYLVVKGETEHREYFRDGRMFRWLEGFEKVVRAEGDPAFAEESKNRLAYSAAYLDGVRMARESCTAKKTCNVTLK